MNFGDELRRSVANKEKEREKEEEKAFQMMVGKYTSIIQQWCMTAANGGKRSIEAYISNRTDVGGLDGEYYAITPEEIMSPKLYVRNFYRGCNYDKVCQSYTIKPQYGDRLVKVIRRRFCDRELKSFLIEYEEFPKLFKTYYFLHFKASW